MNDEAEVAYSDDLVEQAVVASTQQVAEEVILQEQTLDDVTAHLASLIVDTQIRETADEELKSYIYQVEVTTAIEGRLQELSEEMVEEAMRSLLG